MSALTPAARPHDAAAVLDHPTGVVGVERGEWHRRHGEARRARTREEEAGENRRERRRGGNLGRLVERRDHERIPEPRPHPRRLPDRRQDLRHRPLGEPPVVPARAGDEPERAGNDP